MKFAPATLVALVLSLAPAAHGQQPNIRPEPDARGEVVVAEPQHKGVTAAAPIPPALHIKNEGGSDGAGLCVYASMVMNGAWQKIADLIGLKQSALWRYVKGRPGGSYPTKLVQDVASVYGDQVKVVSYYGKDATVMQDWTSKGYPVGATMGTGRNYNYQPISHMISLLHFEQGGWACVLDNNFPGVYSWMPAAEFEKRWKATSGDGWAARWEGPAPDNGRPDGSAPDSPIGLAILAFAVAVAAYILHGGPGRARPKLKLAA